MSDPNDFFQILDKLNSSYLSNKSLAGYSGSQIANQSIHQLSPALNSYIAKNPIPQMLSAQSDMSDIMTQETNYLNHVQSNMARDVQTGERTLMLNDSNRKKYYAYVVIVMVWVGVLAILLILLFLNKSIGIPFNFFFIVLVAGTLCWTLWYLYQMSLRDPTDFDKLHLDKPFVSPGFVNPKGSKLGSWLFGIDCIGPGCCPPGNPYDLVYDSTANQCVLRTTVGSSGTGTSTTTTTVTTPVGTSSMRSGSTGVASTGVASTGIASTGVASSVDNVNGGVQPKPASYLAGGSGITPFPGGSGSTQDVVVNTGNQARMVSGGTTGTPPFSMTSLGSGSGTTATTPFVGSSSGNIDYQPSSRAASTTPPFSGSSMGSGSGTTSTTPFVGSSSGNLNINSQSSSRAVSTSAPPTITNVGTCCTDNDCLFVQGTNITNAVSLKVVSSDGKNTRTYTGSTGPYKVVYATNLYCTSPPNGNAYLVRIPPSDFKWMQEGNITVNLTDVGGTTTFTRSSPISISVNYGTFCNNNTVTEWLSYINGPDKYNSAGLMQPPINAVAQGTNSDGTIKYWIDVGNKTFQCATTNPCTSATGTVHDMMNSKDGFMTMKDFLSYYPPQFPMQLFKDYQYNFACESEEKYCSPKVDKYR